MEQIPHRHLCLFAALSVLLCAACDKIAVPAGHSSPSVEDLKAFLAEQLPPELKLVDVQPEFVPSGEGRYSGNLKITAAVREDLLAPLESMAVLREAGLQFDQAQAAVKRLEDVALPFRDSAMPLPNPDTFKPRFFRQVMQADHPFPIYAKCRAEKIVDRWQFSGLQFGDIPELKGVLRPQVQGPVLVNGTPEADAAIKSAVAEFNGFPAKVEAAEQSYLAALKTACGPGSRYTGAWRIRNQVRELVLEFQELKMDGQLIRATLRDPADPGVERRFTGSLCLPGSGKTGPIKLEADPDSGRRVKTDDLDWFFQRLDINVVLRLEPSDRNRLVGWRSDWDWANYSSITMARIGGP